MLNIATNLDTELFESSVVLFRDGWLREKLRNNSIPVAILKSARSWDVGFMWRLLRYIKNNEPKIIHAHLPDANVYCSLAGFLSGVPVIATYHGKIVASLSMRFSSRIKFFLVSLLANKVVAVSDYLKTELCRVAGFRENKVVTIHNGVSPRLPNPGFDVIAKKKELGILPGEFLIGNVANMRPDKGYEYFIKAAALIHVSIPHTKFLVIGEEKPDIKAMMENEINELNLGNSVLFMGFREDVSELLNILDVFMLSSVSEGLSIATIEAMSVGVPVVATLCGGPNEIIIDGENGFLVPIKDEKSLASKVIFILKNKDTANKLTAKAKVHVNERFSIEHMIRQYQELYRGIHGK